ncbi:MAG: AsmA family protein [Gammaproteobacteria bacterium]|nr:AsmA family protein [Gammaproteobacteria bacterium]
MRSVQSSDTAVYPNMIKRIAIVFGILIALLIAALVLIPLLFNPNDYKDKIADLARDATGRELRIIDDMRLSLFPWIGVEFGRVELANAAGFDARPFARFTAAKVKVRLLPLFQRRIEIDTVTLHGFELALETAADGRTNWDDLAARGAAQNGANEPPAPPVSGDEAALALPAALSIGGLDVRDGALHWRDEAADTQADITGLRLTSDRIETGKPVDLELAFDLHGTRPAVDGRLELALRLDADLAQQRVRAQNLRLDARLAGADLPLGKLDLKLQGDAEADLVTQIYQLDKLRLITNVNGAQPAIDTRLELAARVVADLKQQRLRAGNLQLEATLTGADLPLDKLEFKLQGDAAADLAGQIYQMDKLRLTAALSGANLPGKRIALDYQGRVAADIGKQTAELPDFVLAAQGVTLRGTLRATRLQEVPAIAGHLEAEAFNPRELLKSLAIDAPETADASVLTRAALGLDLEADGERAAVTALKLQLDDSTLTGTASVRDFAAPALAFDLALDGIDLDRYLPPPRDEPVAATPAAAAPAAAQLPLDTLRALNIDGRLRAGQLRVSGLSLADLRATVRARDGLIALAPLGASLYGGHYAGNIRLDARGATPAFSFNESLTGIQAQPLLKDLLDNETFSGTADFALEATASGDTEAALLGSLNGTARFKLRDGAVKGFNAAQLIREAKAKFEGRPAPPPSSDQTDFSDLGATLRFAGGIARNDDLQANSPYLRVGGKGEANLLERKLDYRLRVKLVGSEIGQGGESAGDLKGIEIPIRISGAFAAPSVALDGAVISEALKQKAKAAVQQAVDANKDKVEQKLEQKKQEIKKDTEQKLKNKLKELLQ